MKNRNLIIASLAILLINVIFLSSAGGMIYYFELIEKYFGVICFVLNAYCLLFLIYIMKKFG